MKKDRFIKAEEQRRGRPLTQAELNAVVMVMLGDSELGKRKLFPKLRKAIDEAGVP